MALAASLHYTSVYICIPKHLTHVIGNELYMLNRKSIYYDKNRSMFVLLLKLIHFNKIV